MSRLSPVRQRAPLALLLLVATVAWADEVDELAEAVRSSLASANPMVAFYEGLAAMDDFVLAGPDVERALDQGGAPRDGALGQFLRGVTRLEKRGDRTRTERLGPLTVKSPDGYLRVAAVSSCRFELRPDGDLLMDDVEGIRVGYSRFLMVPLERIVYTTERGRAVAHATLRLGFFSREVTLDVGVDAVGLAGALPDGD